MYIVKHYITEDDDVGGGAQIDAYELLPAVNVLGQLPSDFEENIVCYYFNEAICCIKYPVA